MTAKRRPITQTELAEKLGLSQFTVSMALRGSERIAPETREKILKKAAQLGYRVNAAASATASGRFGGVALLRSSNPNLWWLPVDMLHGVQTGLEKTRQRLSMLRADSEVLNDESGLHGILRELSADGLLVHWGAELPAHFPELVRRHRIPVIYINLRMEFDSIYPDDLQCARRCAEYLVGKGHRKLGLVSAHFESHFSVEERREGYVTRARELGASVLTVDQSDLRDALDPALVVRLKEMMSGKNAPTGWMGYSITECQAIWLAAKELGKSIPKEISILCPSQEHTHRCADRIRWTGFEIPWMPIGEEACQMLAKKIESPGKKIPSVRFGCWWRDGETA